MPRNTLVDEFKRTSVEKRIRKLSGYEVEAYVFGYEFKHPINGSISEKYVINLKIPINGFCLYFEGETTTGLENCIKQTILCINDIIEQYNNLSINKPFLASIFIKNQMLIMQDFHNYSFYTMLDEIEIAEILDNIFSGSKSIEECFVKFNNYDFESIEKIADERIMELGGPC